MGNEVRRQVFYFGVRENIPFLFLRIPHPELIKLVLTIGVIFAAGRLYYPSRVELQLIQKISACRLMKIPATLRSLLQDRSMVVAMSAFLVRWMFWNVGMRKEDRYAPFPSAVIYRVPRPLPPSMCFNGTYQERRNFTVTEAECGLTWKARDELPDVQYVPVVYSPTLRKFSCLSPSSMVAYGSICIDNGTVSGTKDAYVYDMHSLWSRCELNGYDCHGIESVRTHNNGTTWMMISHPIRGQRVEFIRLRRLGDASLGEGYFWWRSGKSTEHVLKIMLSMRSQLNRATCCDTSRDVPVGEKHAHLYIDLQILFSLASLEAVMNGHGRREQAVADHFSEVIVELLSAENERELEA